MARRSPEGHSDFPTTNWSNVRQAGAATPAGREGLDDLLRRYRPALWSHLVYRKKLSADRADDVVQSFIQEKILQRNLLSVADPGRGKLRTLLLTALDRFLIDCRRKESAAGVVTALPADAQEEAGPDVFGVAWAMQVLVEALRRTRAECEAKGWRALWGVFAGRALAPLGGAEPLPYQLLADRFGLDSAKQAANRYHTALALFQRHFRAELAATAGDDVEAEVGHFLSLVSHASAELVEQLRIHLWTEIPEVTMSCTEQPRLVGAALARLLELSHPAVSPAALLGQTLTAPFPLQQEASEAAPATLGELLHQDRPCPGLLERVKDFAKEHRTDPESPLGAEVATLLYYATLAAALARCGRRITRHDDDTLRRGFRWAGEQPWVDGPTRQLFREALLKLDDTQGPPA